MNIWKTLNAFSSLGILLTIIGDLSKRLGEAITGANLAPRTSLPNADDKVRSQDPPAQGAEDEKPDESQTSFLFIGGTDTVPTEKE